MSSSEDFRADGLSFVCIDAREEKRAYLVNFLDDGPDVSAYGPALVQRCEGTQGERNRPCACGRWFAMNTIKNVWTETHGWESARAAGREARSQITRVIGKRKDV